MKITLNNMNDVYKSKLVNTETMELRGYKLIKELFVDSSGFGMDNEPALTQSQFTKELTSLLKKYDSLYATITDAGQFQVYVGLFIKSGKSKAKKIGNNTYEIDYGNGKTAIRLHNTDILKFDDKTSSVTLNTGGWHTVTTKARMNQYLGSRWTVFQKDFEWFVQDNNNYSQMPFAENMVLPI